MSVPDIGKLTQEETAELLRACIIMLPDDVAFDAITAVLSREQRMELAEMWGAS